MGKITIERETLEPCPFCGAEAEILTIPEDHPDAGAMFVQCCDSRCVTSSALLYPLMDDVRALLVERWNRRAALAAQPADAQPVAWRHSNTGQLYDAEEDVPLADGDEWAEPLYAAPAIQQAPAAWRQWSAKLHDWDYQTNRGDLRPDTPADPLFVAAAQPAPAAVPPGMALVPIEPTPGIITTGTVALMKASDSDLDATREEIAATYRAMIAAAGDKP